MLAGWELLVALARMTLCVCLFEVVDREFCVWGEGFDGCVSEEFFDVVWVGAVPDELGGAASPEGVWGKGCGEI